ncbi:MAG TPA: hypothetical protein PLW31_03130 [Bacteroidales bacterium]|nr:hypothetical protein [Bacteroidales bacterium]
MTTLKESNYIIFTLKTEKVTPALKPEKHYSIIYSPIKTKIHFNEIVSSIPKEKGMVAIFGEKDQTLKLLKTFTRQNDLRNQFRNSLEKMHDGSMTTHFDWMVDRLKTSGFKRLRIYAASVA